jgi:hypothetical protein
VHNKIEHRNIVAYGGFKKSINKSMSLYRRKYLKHNGEGMTMSQRKPKFIERVGWENEMKLFFLADSKSHIAKLQLSLQAVTASFRWGCS